MLTMDEYIKRDFVMKKIMATKWMDGHDGAMAMAIAASAPAADVERVVRCKDCKFSQADGHVRTCEGYWFELSEYAVSVKDDAVCSYGERRDDA